MVLTLKLMCPRFKTLPRVLVCDAIQKKREREKYEGFAFGAISVVHNIPLISPLTVPYSALMDKGCESFISVI